MRRNNGKWYSVPCVWFSIAFCFSGFNQKEVNKNIFENSGPDSG